MFSCARVVVWGCVLAMGNCLYAQGEPLYFSAVSPWEKEQETLPRRMQVSVAAALVHNVLRDRDGAVVSRYMYGGQAEGFVHLWQNVEIGVTGSRFTGAGMKTQVLSEISYQMAGGLLKWTLTPQTASEVYILVGAGYARERMRFAVAPA